MQTGTNTRHATITTLEVCPKGVDHAHTPAHTLVRPPAVLDEDGKPLQGGACAPEVVLFLLTFLAIQPAQAKHFLI